ncbi:MULTISPECIES: hypothetical protein [unclassified Variovorax]|uniref:hypothetical protein n=1 Tax=unclassified Variovorax TaxID=663243 RepID=UPI0034E9635F
MATVTTAAGKMGVVTVLLQRAGTGDPVVQAASPPPLTMAVLTTPGAGTATVGVTGMTKLMDAPTASPAGMAQATT